MRKARKHQESCFKQKNIWCESWDWSAKASAFDCRSIRKLSGTSNWETFPGITWISPWTNWRRWLGRRRSGYLYLDCCPCDPDPDKLAWKLSTLSTPHWATWSVWLPVSSFKWCECTENVVKNFSLVAGIPVRWRTVILKKENLWFWAPPPKRARNQSWRRLEYRHALRVGGAECINTCMVM